MTPEQLVEVERIKQLKARYFRLMDTKDWSGLARVFTADAELDVTDDAEGRVVHETAPATASAISSTSVSETVRMSSRRRSSAMRPTTGGVPWRSARAVWSGD